MAEGFKIADAYVEVEAEIDEAEVYRTSSTIGESAGLNLGDKLSAGVRSKLRDDRGRFRKDGEGVGEGLGEGAGRSMGRTIGATLSGHLPTIFSNPYVLGAAAAAGALIAPALGAGIAGGLIGGAGLGVIAGGIALIAKDVRIQSAARDIQTSLFDIDTTETEAKLAAWRERLKAARKSGNAEAIAEAKQHVKALSRDIQQAAAFNAKNTSLKDMASVFVAPTVRALGIFEAALVRIKPKIGAMFDQLAKSGAIESLATGITGLVENALPGFMKMIEASGPFLKSLGPGLTQLGKGMSTFFEQIAKAGPDATAFFGDLLGFLSGQLAFWGGLIRVLAVAYSKLRLFFTSIPGWASAAGSWFANLWSSITEKGSAVIAWFASLPGIVGGWISSVAAAIGARGAAILNWFSLLPGRIGAFLATIPGRARAFFVSAFDAITTAVGFGIGTVVMMWATLPERIFNAAVSLIAKVRSLFNQARAAAITTVASLATSVIRFFIELPPRAYNAAVGLIARIRTLFSNARSTATSTAGSLVTSVITMIGTIPNKAGAALSAFASVVAAKLRAAVSGAFSIGRDIVSGVINGIQSMVGAAAAAARRAAGNIVGGFKGALGIGSPSKVMAREVGRWILPGIGAGVQSSIPAARRHVQAAADSLVPQVPGAAGTPVSGALSGPSGGVNYYFAPGSITIDASRLRSVEDLIKMINDLQRTARSMRPRTAMVGVR